MMEEMVIYAVIDNLQSVLSFVDRQLEDRITEVKGLLDYMLK